MSLEFYLGCVGTVFILKYGSILNSIRDVLTSCNYFFEDLFKCSLCLGFWVGCFWSLIYGGHLYTPFAVSAICWSADTILQFIQGLDLLVMKRVKS